MTMNSTNDLYIYIYIYETEDPKDPETTYKLPQMQYEAKDKKY